MIEADIRRPKDLLRPGYIFIMLVVILPIYVSGYLGKFAIDTFIKSQESMALQIEELKQENKQFQKEVIELKFLIIEMRKENENLIRQSNSK